MILILVLIPSIWERALVTIKQFTVAERFGNLNCKKESLYLQKFGDQKKTFKKKIMDARLHSVVHSRKYYFYIIHYKLLNGDDKYVQMRSKYCSKHSIYLACSNSKCKAFITLQVLSPDLIKEIEQNQYVLNVQGSEELILDTKNYGNLKHKCRSCLASRDENGFCDKTRHEDICLKSIPTTKKVYI